jgi:DNA-binding NarL/FixJ family response regulator
MLSSDLTQRLVRQFTSRPAPRAAEALPEALAVLTSRELEVLKLVAHGLSNDEIAATLFVSPSTVKTHVVRILAKLQVRDRTQAAVAAYEHGLVVADR